MLARKIFYHKNEELVLIAIKPSNASTLIHPDKSQGPKHALNGMLNTILATYPRLQKPYLISIDTKVCSTLASQVHLLTTYDTSNFYCDIITSQPYKTTCDHMDAGKESKVTNIHLKNQRNECK